MAPTGIAVEYGGRKMRSKAEAVAAFDLDHKGIRWQYEPYRFQRGEEVYIPDFVIEATATVIEVKVAGNYDPAEVNRKFDIVKHTWPHATCVLWVGTWHRENAYFGGPLYTFTEIPHDPALSGPRPQPSSIPAPRLTRCNAHGCGNYAMAATSTCWDHTPRMCDRCGEIVYGAVLCEPCSADDDIIRELSYLANGIAEAEGRNRYAHWQNWLNNALGVEKGRRRMDADAELAQTYWHKLADHLMGRGVDLEDLFARNRSRRQ